ncbi:serine/threonine-protein kinase atr-like [Gordionus sp. m RMFG-2023]|uniref:serine/threonine-protein kinase atr-like n=1 Tax=Gordionus sp. m RMFG-2023 TaxID=3053472 RepID=UPI0031FD3C3A
MLNYVHRLAKYDELTHIWSITNNELVLIDQNLEKLFDKYNPIIQECMPVTKFTTYMLNIIIILLDNKFKNKNSSKSLDQTLNIDYYVQIIHKMKLLQKFTQCLKLRQSLINVILSSTLFSLGIDVAFKDISEFFIEPSKLKIHFTNIIKSKAMTETFKNVSTQESNSQVLATLSSFLSDQKSMQLFDILYILKEYLFSLELSLTLSALIHSKSSILNDPYFAPLDKLLTDIINILWKSDFSQCISKISLSYFDESEGYLYDSKEGNLYFKHILPILSRLITRIIFTYNLFVTDESLSQSQKFTLETILYSSNLPFFKFNSITPIQKKILQDNIDYSPFLNTENLALLAIISPMILPEERMDGWLREVTNIKLDRNLRYRLLRLFPLMLSTFREKLLLKVLHSWKEYKVSLIDVSTNFNIFRHLTKYPCSLAASHSKPLFIDYRSAFGFNCLICDSKLELSSAYSLMDTDSYYSCYTEFTTKYLDILLFESAKSNRKNILSYLDPILHHHISYIYDSTDGHVLDRLMLSMPAILKFLSFLEPSKLETIIKRLSLSVEKAYLFCKVERNLKRLLFAIDLMGKFLINYISFIKKSVGDFNCTLSYRVLETHITNLFESSLFLTPLVSAKAVYHLLAIAKRSGKSLIQLYETYSASVSNLIVNAIHEQSLLERNPEEVLFKFSKLLGFTNFSKFFDLSLKWLLPEAIRMCLLHKNESYENGESLEIVKIDSCSALISAAGLDKLRVIVDNMKHIYPYFALHHPTLMQSLALYVHSVTKVEFGRLIIQDAQNICNHLVSRIPGCHERRTLESLYLLSKYEDKYKSDETGSMNIEIILEGDNVLLEEVVRNSLNPRILGILYYFDARFRKYMNLYAMTEDEEEKSNDLTGSFVSLIKFLGPAAILKYKIKILATLKIGINNIGKYRESTRTTNFGLLIQAYTTVIDYLEPSILREVASQILITFDSEFIKSLALSENYQNGIILIYNHLFKKLEHQSSDMTLTKEYILLSENNILIERLFIPHICLERTYPDFDSYSFIQLPCVRCLQTKMDCPSFDSSKFNIRHLISTIRQGLSCSENQAGALISYIKALKRLLFNNFATIQLYVYHAQKLTPLDSLDETIYELIICLLTALTNFRNHNRIAKHTNICTKRKTYTELPEDMSECLNLFSHCVGLIGALDPGRLLHYIHHQTDKQLIKMPSSLAGIYYNLDSDEFTFTLLAMLDKIFNAASDAGMQDCAAFVMQEILALFNEIPMTTDVNQKNFFWSKIPAELKPTLTPLLSSHYRMTNTITYDQFPPSTPLFVSYYNSPTDIRCRSKWLDFDRWLIDWCGCAINLLTTTNLARRESDGINTERRLYKIFKVCSYAFKYDAGLARFVIPFVCLNLILSSDESTTCYFVIIELEAIINCLFHIKQAYKKIEQSDDSYNNNNFESSNKGITTDRIQHDQRLDMIRKCLFTVFDILDYISKWRRRHLAIILSHSRLTSPLISSRFGPNSPKVCPKIKEADPQFSALERFHIRLPYEGMAKAAYSIQDYHRALIYHEIDWRTRASPKCFDADLLIKLYGALNEPDGIGGVNAHNSVGSGNKRSTKQQIMYFQSQGHYQECAACYELAITSEPLNISNYLGKIESLLCLEQAETAFNYSRGVLFSNKTWANEILPYQVECLRRLNRWDELDALIKPDASSKPFNPPYHDIDKSDNWFYFLGHALSIIRNDSGSSQFFAILKRMTLHQSNSLRYAPHFVTGAPFVFADYYRGNYQTLLKFHLISDLEQAAHILRGYSNASRTIKPCQLAIISTEDPKPDLNRLFSLSERRLKNVQHSFTCMEPLLSLHRTLADVARHILPSKFEAELQLHRGRLYLESAKLARKCGYLQTAQHFLLHTKDFNLPQYQIERAKWLARKGLRQQAIQALRDCLDTHFPQQDDQGDFPTLSYQRRRELCKTLTLLGNYTEEACHLDSPAILAYYERSIKVEPTLEHGYFHSARHYDKLYQRSIPCSSIRAEAARRAVEFYSRALKRGTKYCHQALPRLLSVWLDYGAETFANIKNNSKNDMTLKILSNNLDLINDCVTDLIDDGMSSSIFLTAYPQLISRICHPHVQVWEVLKHCLVTVLRNNKEKVFWMTVAVSKSSHQIRAERCKQIYLEAIRIDHGSKVSNDKSNSDLAKYLSDATKLADKLLEIANREVEQPGFTTLQMSVHFRNFKKLLEDPNLSHIIIPLLSEMSINPNCYSINSDASSESMPTNGDNNETPPSKKAKFYDKFSDLSNLNMNSLDNIENYREKIYIVGIEDDIEVLPSLQRPKKISFRTSNGKSYPMLCKPKDDLRKDSRLMEFNALVNDCLLRNHESRKRNLKIKTYSVTPLNEECGLIEWVPNMQPYRIILQELYRENGKVMSSKEMIEHRLPANSPLEKKLNVYKKKLLPFFSPPIFHEWFTRSFSDPTSWYLAKLSYSRTLAVMSMVGYILGLGDRHGENILIDKISGEVLHVDFNCLFNKGLTFEYPEKVEFRLTHNMVDAMGPLGYEGIFRQACEVTLMVMRNQKDLLMSVLKPFIHDPLLEWSGCNNSFKSERVPSRNRLHLQPSQVACDKSLIKQRHDIETYNIQARIHVNNIELRLTGHVDYRNNQNDSNKPENNGKRNKHLNGNLGIDSNGNKEDCNSSSTILVTESVGLPLSIAGQVDYLIRQTTDENLLCQMYIGWAPFF